MTIPRNLSFLAQGASSTGVLGTANGGTNLTSFTVNGIPYASSSSALNTSSDLTWTGSALVVNGNQTLGNGTGQRFLNFNTSTGSYILGQISSANTYFVGDTVSALGTGSGYITYVYGANPTIWYNNGSETARIHASGGVSIGNRTDPGAGNLSVTGTGKFGTTVSVGAATPSASGAGITFPATQSASTDVNTLDDYEEGTWTPIQGAGLVVIGTFSSEGNYTKIGRMVTVTGSLAGSTSISCGPTAILTRVPFAGIAGNSTGMGSVTNNDLNLSNTCWLTPNDTPLYVMQTIATTVRIWFSLTYFVS